MKNVIILTCLFLTCLLSSAISRGSHNELDCYSELNNKTYQVTSMNGNFVLGSLTYSNGVYTTSVNKGVVKTYLSSRGISNVLDENITMEVIDNGLYLYFKIVGTDNIVIYADDVVVNPHSDGTVAGVTSGGGETHTCDGSCGGANSIFSRCTSCEFVRKNGKITGCKCTHSAGECCHSVTSSGQAVLSGN